MCQLQKKPKNPHTIYNFKSCIANFSTKANNSVSSGSDEMHLIRYKRYLSVFD